MGAVKPTELILNPTMEVTAAEGGRYRLRLPLQGRTTEASAYQVNLLQSFNDGSSIDAVIGAFPFDKESSREFLERCVAQNVLLPRDPDGEPLFPTRAQPPVTLFQCPPFDPKRPPAFAFLGVPYDGATTGMPGARFGPTSIRQAGTSARYRLDRLKLQPEGFFDFASGRRLLEGIQLADAGDVSFTAGEDLASMMDRVTASVKDVLRAGSVPIVFGGDHSISYGVLSAFKGRRFGILHIDAHTDLGSYPGDPLHHGTVFVHVLRELPQLERVVQVGLRGIAEGLAGGEGDPRVFPIGIDTFRRQGVEAIVARLPEDLELYVSLDIDAVDPAFAPSTGTPVPGGLFPHELKELLRAVTQKRGLIGMDVVEVGAAHGPSDGTPQVAIEAVLTAMDGAVEFIRNALVDEAQAQPSPAPAVLPRSS